MNSTAISENTVDGQEICNSNELTGKWLNKLQNPKPSVANC